MTPRILTLSVITSLLVGCMASEDVTHRPEGLTPVDVIDVQTDLTAQFPDANAFSALAPSGEGVIFALDGTATYVNLAFGTQLESTKLPVPTMPPSGSTIPATSRRRAIAGQLCAAATCDTTAVSLVAAFTFAFNLMIPRRGR